MNENVSNPNADSPKLSFRARLTEVLDKKLNERIDMARSWFEKTYEAAEQAVYDCAKSLDDQFFSTCGNQVCFTFLLRVMHCEDGRFIAELGVFGPCGEVIYSLTSVDCDFSLNFNWSAKEGDNVEEMLFQAMDEILSEKLEVPTGAVYEKSLPLESGYVGTVALKYVQVPYYIS